MTLIVNVKKTLGAFNLDAAFSTGGGLTALFGPSGAGKTTLAHMVAGLVTPHEGQIAIKGQLLFDSRTATNLAVHRRNIGYIFQDARLFPHLTVRQNLNFSRLFGRGERNPASFDHIVDLLGIKGLLDRRPGTLSGGEKQRVAIGRALLSNPSLLIMDEPLASLDLARRAEILPYIERLRDESRIPIIYVSHAIEEVIRLADTMVLMESGRVRAAGPVDDILNRLDLTDLTGNPETGNPEMGSVVDAIVMAQDKQYSLTILQVAGSDIIVPRLDMNLQTKVRLRVRARDVAIALERPTGLSIRNILAATIVEMNKPRGPFIELKLDIGGAFLISRITHLAAVDMRLEVGAKVFALIKSVAIDRRGLGYGDS